MKLIQILALATAMATTAMAQNSGASGQTKATPTPTPAPAAAGKATGAAQPGTKKAATTAQQPAAKAVTGTPAKAAAGKGAATAQGGAATGAPSKPPVTTTAIPVKAQTSTGAAAKGTPAPVVPAKSTGKSTETKKGDTKKTETKKVDAAKAPAVIAVKPVQGTKKAGSTPAKAPAKTPAPKVTQTGPALKPAEKPKPTARSFGQHGRRDPFVSPIVAKEGGLNRPPSNCTSGKRCLVIPELVLQGTVKDTSGKMIAVVANSIKKTYFLRENDQVFQGSVEKITSDSIIFREFIKDALGRETAREVVKKLVPTT